MKRLLIASVLAATLLLSACNPNDPTTTVPSAAETTTAAETESVETTTASTEETSVSEGSSDPTGYMPIEGIESPNLKDGVWDDVISGVQIKGGEEKNPEISWNPVEGAKEYAVYMIDTDAGNFLHMKACGITETKIEAGSLGVKEYVGPNPPEGTHNYQVIIYALKDTPETYPGTKAAPFLREKFEKRLDESATILAMGSISGTYSVN